MEPQTLAIGGFEQEEDTGLRQVLLCGVTFTVDVFQAMLLFDAVDDEGEVSVRYDKAKAIIKQMGGPDVSTAACMAFFKVMTETCETLKKNTVLAIEDAPELPTTFQEQEIPSN